MKTVAKGFMRGVAIVSGATLIVTVTILMPRGAPYAQVAKADARTERCKELLKKDISGLTDEQLRVLKVCLAPLERRRKEKAESADQNLAPAERKAPLRIYGK